LFYKPILKKGNLNFFFFFFFFLNAERKALLCYLLKTTTQGYTQSLTTYVIDTADTTAGTTATLQCGYSWFSAMSVLTPYHPPPEPHSDRIVIPRCTLHI
jgi:hypothetical protein